MSLNQEKPICKEGKNQVDVLRQLAFDREGLTALKMLGAYDCMARDVWLQILIVCVCLTKIQCIIGITRIIFFVLPQQCTYSQEESNAVYDTHSFVAGTSKLKAAKSSPLHQGKSQPRDRAAREY